jgi:hypothetical protein
MDYCKPEAGTPEHRCIELAFSLVCSADVSNWQKLKWMQYWRTTWEMNKIKKNIYININPKSETVFLLLCIFVTEKRNETGVLEKPT